MDILLHLKCSSTCFLTNAVPENDPSENATAGIPLVQQINFGSIVNDSVDHRSVNLDLDSLDFKSSESFLKKDSPDQKLRIWICTKEPEIHFKIENPFLDSPKGTHPFVSSRT